MDDGEIIGAEWVAEKRATSHRCLLGSLTYFRPQNMNTLGGSF